MIILSQFGTLSGKLGGTVAQRDRAASRLVARTARKRTPSAPRAESSSLLASTATQWRTLSAGLRAEWSALAASSSPRAGGGGRAFSSGFHLFTHCNRNLLSIGSQVVLSIPWQPPSFPPLYAFEAQPVYDSPQPPWNLAGLLVTLQGSLLAGLTAILSATRPGSTATSTFPLSAYRDILIFNPDTQAVFDALPAYLAAGLQPLPAGCIGFSLRLIDPRGGYSSPRYYSRCRYYGTPWNQFPPYTVIIQTEGQTAAAIPAQPIEIDGTPVAD